MSAPMRNIKLTIEYDGTNYHGWQSQKGTGRPTIQDTIEAAIQQRSGTFCPLASSGRTDAGVHAHAHAANFLTGHGMPPGAWMPALNTVLPPDIRIIASEEVPLVFHARRSAIGKVYRYRILNRPASSALHRNHAWHIKRPLEIDAMRAAAAHLIGTHDFTSFRASGCQAKTAIRTMRSITIARHGQFIEISLEADAFLQHMARNIVGTLVDVGLNQRSPAAVASLLAARDRTQAGRIAPAYGLYLIEVFY